jgi:hypothetical protein
MFSLGFKSGLIPGQERGRILLRIKKKKLVFWSYGMMLGPVEIYTFFSIPFSPKYETFTHGMNISNYLLMIPI